MRFLGLFLLGAALLASRAQAGAPERPNIILVLADDLGLHELGAYGQEKIRTPNIDRLAREGMRFTRFYSASTVCAPARACRTVRWPGVSCFFRLRVGVMGRTA